MAEVVELDVVLVEIGYPAALDVVAWKRTHEYPVEPEYADHDIVAILVANEIAIPVTADGAPDPLLGAADLYVCPAGRFA